MANSADINIYIKVFDKESKKLVKAAQQIENAFKGVEKAAKDLASASDKAENELKKTSSQMKKAENNADKFRNALKQVRKASVIAASGFISIGDGVNQARLSMKKFGSRVEALGGRMNVLGQRMTFFLSLPIALALGDIVKTGAEWDKQMVTIAKTTDLSNESLESFAKELLHVNDTIPVTNEDLGNIAISAGKAGIGFDNMQKAQEAAKNGNKELAKQLEGAATNEILQFTEIVALATAAWDGFTGEEAAASLVQLGAIFDLSISEMENMASTIAHVADAANLAERDIIDAMARMSNAALFDVPAQDAVAFASTLVEVTQIASRSGTEINSALFFMAKNIEDAAKVANSSADDFAELLDTDPSQALFAFAKGLGEIESNTEKVRVANAVLGQVGAKALGPISEQVDRLNDLMLLSNDAWKENTRLRKEAARQAESINGQWTILTENVKAFKLAIFDTFKGLLVPILREANYAVISITQSFENLGPEQKRKFLLIAAAISAAVVAAGPLLLMAGLLITAFGALITAVGALLSPLGIVGLWAAFKVGSSIFQEVASASEMLGGGWQGLAGVAVVLANSLGLIQDQKMEAYLSKLGISTEDYGFQVELVKEQIQEWREKIEKFVQDVKNAIDWIVEHKDGIITLIKTLGFLVVAIKMLSIAATIATNIGTLTKSLGLGAKGLLWVVNALGLPATGALAVLAAAIVIVGDAAIKYKGAIDDLSESGKTLEGQMDLLNQAIAEAPTDEASEKFRKLREEQALLIEEVKRVENRHKSLGGVFEIVGDGMKSIAGSIIPRLGDAFASVGEVLKNFYETLGGYAVDVFEKGKDIGKNMILGFIDGLWGNVGNMWEAVKSVAHGAVATAEDALGIQSPSKVFAQIGEYSAMGFVEGLKSVDGMTAGINMIPDNIPSMNSLQGSQSSQIVRQQSSVQQETHIHYEYSPKVGAMIASKGEQRDFMREIRKLMAEENQRYGIDPNLAYDTGIVTQS